MSGSRSKFYVATPPSSQRHSMYEEPPDSSYVNAGGGGLSSSTATLPSVAGSVDRLTDSAEEKKRKKKKKSGGFFGPLHPSFSLGRLRRSTSSVVAPADPTSRRDSSSQTDGPPGFGEIGVQTHNAPTVDVPVQTGFDEWEDVTARTTRSFFPSASSSFYHRPGWRFPRGPTGLRFAAGQQPSPLAPAPKLTGTGAVSAPGPANGRVAFASAPKSDGTAAASTPEPCGAVVTPLDTSRVLKYASPSISATDGSGLGAGRVDGAVITSPEIAAPSPNAGVTSGIGDPFNRVVVESPTEQNPDQPKRDSIANPDSTTTSGKKSAAGPQQASAKLVNFSPPLDKPSALKIERTDSPVRHSAKIKTVHFDLSDSDSSESNNNNIKDESSLNVRKESEPAGVSSRNLDKDFEDLLRNLDIIVNDRVEPPANNPTVNDLKISFSSFQKSPPQETLLSTKLKSAFDVLLPSILETYENCEVEQLPSDLATSNNSESEKSGEQITKINPLGELVEEELVNTLPTPTTTVENNSKISKDDSEKSTSAEDVYTSSKSDLFVVNDGNRDNVYESGIKENVLKTVNLPTLPSFFDSAPRSSEPPQSISADSSAELAQNNSSENEDRMSTTSKPREIDQRSTTFENLEQLEEDIIRSLRDGAGEGFRGVPTPTESPDHAAARIRRGVLDRLLHHVGCGEGAPSSNGMIGHEDGVAALAIEATATQFEASRLQEQIGSLSSGVSHASPRIPEVDASSSDAGKMDSSSKNSLFCIPGEKPPSSTGRSAASDLSAGGGANDESDFSAGKDDRSDAGISCDFTPCLRPSEIRKKSPFLDAIISRSSPEKSHYRSPELAPPESEASETHLDDRCDFAPCLKPSRVQNGVLSEITTACASVDGEFLDSIPRIPENPNDGIPRIPESSENSIRRMPENSNDRIHRMPESSNDGIHRMLESSNDGIHRMPKIAKDRIHRVPESSVDGISKISENSNHKRPVVFECPDDRMPRDDEVSHTSEVTIVLQTPLRQFLENGRDPGAEIRDNPSISGDETVVEIGPVYSVQKSSPPLHYANRQIPPSTVTPAPPPPPPPTTTTTSVRVTGRDGGSSSETGPRQNSRQSSNLSLVADRGPPPKSKSPVMSELEMRFEARRRRDQGNDERSDSCDRNAEMKSGSHENSFVPPTSATTATTYEASRTRGHARTENDLGGRQQQQHLYSPAKSSITAAEVQLLPRGAVLLDERVTEDADSGLVHTDRRFGLPVREVLRERTTTAAFVPAPPKYDGIGPLEDGLPLAPRNSVKKENMHNWYKTMFKSLHKADLPNDNQEYIIGYSSEPETSQKERALRKKSSTLDSRAGSGKAKDPPSAGSSRQQMPSVAKSSVDVYGVVHPRPIEDYEPGHSSVTDDEYTVGYKRFLPALNAPKPSYEFKNGYEPETSYTRNLSPLGEAPPDPAQQKVWYQEVQRGGEVPQFGLGKPAPDRPKATRPLTLPAHYPTADNGLCQQSNGPFEMQMRHIIHTELQHRMNSPTSSNNQLSPRSAASPSKSPSRSPDPKIPARALFDFRSESPKEVPLRRGDVVLIARQLDGNWYEGESRGRAGIFPVNYVEIVPPETAKSSSRGGSGKVLYDFAAHAPVELSVRKGDAVSLLRRVDDNWYEAKFGEAKGIVPASYMQVLREPHADKRTPSPKPCLKSPRGSTEASTDARPKQTPLSTLSPTSDAGVRGKFPSRVTIKSSGGLIEPVMYTALYGYAPLNSDELELEEGDEVCVVEKCDDGWFVGTSARTGMFGIFPGNYVH